MSNAEVVHNFEICLFNKDRSFQTTRQTILIKPTTPKAGETNIKTNNREVMQFVKEKRSRLKYFL